MVAFGHTAIGVIVGVASYKYLGQTNLVEGLVITGAAACVSHYLADSIPHGHFIKFGNYKIGIGSIIVFDLVLSILLFLGIGYLKYNFSEKLLYLMFGIGGSQLPDVIDGLIYTHAIKPKGLFKIEDDLHHLTHWHGNGPRALLLSIRDIWQVFVVLIALFLI